MKINKDGFKVIEGTDGVPQALYAMIDNINLLYDRLRHLEAVVLRVLPVFRQSYTFDCTDCSHYKAGECKLGLELNEAEDAWDCDEFDDAYKG